MLRVAREPTYTPVDDVMVTWNDMEPYVVPEDMTSANIFKYRLGISNRNNPHGHDSSAILAYLQRPIAYHVFRQRNRMNLNPRRVCSAFIGKRCTHSRTGYDWTIRLPGENAPDSANGWWYYLSDAFFSMASTLSFLNDFVRPNGQNQPKAASGQDARSDDDILTNSIPEQTIDNHSHIEIGNQSHIGIGKQSHIDEDQLSTLTLPSSGRDEDGGKRTRRRRALGMKWPTNLDDLIRQALTESLLNLRNKTRGNYYQIPYPRGKTLKVLHISDTHVDPEYREGANAVCGRPLCCRKSDGTPTNPEDRAGKWGDYRDCDLPIRTLHSLLKHINDTHKDVEVVYWTGDILPHNIWESTVDEAQKEFRDTVEELRAAFPHIPVYPALGNHEVHPVNLVAWLYEEAARLWPSLFEVPKGESSNILRAGFYSVSPLPGLTLLSVNTNFCYYLNWWNYLQIPDPASELQWIIDELQKAESRGDKVHIIGHIPPGYPDCLPTWSRNFRRIVQRFNETVTGMFYGHTHYDEVQVFYDEHGHPTEVAYIGPSVSPFSDLNPAYRIYTIDTETWEILDYETWYMDLLSANVFDQPFWRPLYSARAAYYLPSLSPTEWHTWLQRLIYDEVDFQTHYRFVHRDSQTFVKCDNKECKRERLCTMVTSDTSADDACTRITWQLLRHHYFGLR
ncbi:unnamed protein product [Darwinula stevensoni]|uniref:Sphingomyelin phosphodiesterase n=1 Tax=Darwinula stevensoni TaxID=69355 RepID=A0A7R9A7I5_9CRUS|nr:unnamed protein product [Darwinula stevensoni]CAG0891968.1 unnamed protein product [Darwinula stevensoni]